MEILKYVNLVLLAVSVLTTILATVDIVKALPSKEGEVKHTGIALAIGYIALLGIALLSIWAYYSDFGHEVAQVRTTMLALTGISSSTTYMLLRRGII